MLERRRSPALFEAIHETRTYAISDVANDARIGELRADYLRVNKVTAVLVAPFRQGNKVRGVITHEYQGGSRDWTRDEASFASSLADFVALGITANDRREAEDKLAQFLCRIQIRSDKYASLNGAWFRAFDFGKWDYWASNADIGWGAWSVEAGWGQSWIAATLALREKQTTLWEMTSNSSIAQKLPAVKKQMAANDGRPL